MILKNLQFAILSTLTASLVYPLLILIFTPIFIYRQIIKSIVRFADPKCGPILTAMDATMAVPDPYKNAPSTLCPYFLFSSKVDRSHIVKVVNEQIIDRNVFPELKQRVVKRFGYFFRYPVDNFNVEDHIRYLTPDCPDKPVTRSDLRCLATQHLAKLHFDEERSPWELILVPNLVDESDPSIKSCVLLRVNHCLMDGFCMVHFIQKAAKVPWKLQVGQDTSKVKTRKRGVMEKMKPLLQIIKLLITGPYEAILSFCFANDNSEFLKKTLPTIKPEEKSYAVRAKESRKFDADRVKNVKNAYNVGVNSVLTTMIIEGVIKFMRHRCQDGYSAMSKKGYFQITVPIPGHPDTMTNHWTFAKIPFTVDKDTDLLKQLTRIHNEYNQLKNSIVPLATHFATMLVGMLPVRMMPRADDVPSQTILAVNMPGPGKDVDIFGYEWKDFGFVGNGSLKMPFGAAIQTMSGKFWIDVVGPKSLFRSQEELHLMEDYVYDVLAQLESTAALKKVN